ncbi:MAG: squalene--hopene cyclase [Pirellulaceae bacterium]|jgi:squalene-hopene/tetraprenyl-beta-curcumene cyclase|nr:prenyltransferase/squalene oxidase repeat-containing protein [Thermoguttaceae bacterium]MDI9444692.1 prenyltransferase/squalene oxidase repeat-containing protein [Planctomycetota bacterium]NLY99404.1 squalene--hopene cyclase [Pirellulaceae bacterium]
MIDRNHLTRAYEKARADLLAEQNAEGHWTGELCSSALSTATAVSALASVLRRGSGAADAALMHRLIDGGLDYLAGAQNADGGWGDTDRSLSNIATTMLARAAIHLAGGADPFAAQLAAAERYLQARGGVEGLRRRYGRDKTFAVPILANTAMAGLVSWQAVAPLPFELAAFPQSVYRFLRLPVVSYAIPALVAIGLARFHHRRPLNPLARCVRSLAAGRSLRVAERMQPESGGFLEAAPLTSFVVMSLANIGRADHPIVRNGLRFLADSVRGDGSWPIDTNLATWVTTLAINALDDGSAEPAGRKCLDWLLGCQHRVRHPFTGAEAGGWGWSDLSGAVPDADDTPGAMLALARGARAAGGEQRAAIQQSAAMGLDWLLRLQNRDGGFPTFCRGWGKLPFDRSSTDLTAHALRAIHAWRSLESRGADRATARGRRFLQRSQQSDGSWLPLWFGNQHRPNEDNPVYGTARVLLAYRDLGWLDTEAARRGLRYLAASQREDGGWGAAPSGQASSVEETAVALEALLSAAASPPAQAAIESGLQWLVRAVEENRHRRAAPIGFYFARLWYYEKLYPLIFTVSALREAVRQQHAP